MSGDVNVRITATDEASGAFRGLSAEAVKFGAVIGAASKATELLADAFAKATTGGLKQAVAEADKLNDLSQKLGMGVQQLAAYKLAAEQSGTSLEAVAQGVKALSNQMLAHGDAFRKIGIDTQDADKAFRQLADVFASMPDGMEKSALAFKLFGRSGMELIPTLNLGSKGLDEAAQKAAKYAESMAILAPQADRLNDTLSELHLATQAVYANMASKAVPAMTEIATAMAMAAQESGVLMSLWVGFGGVADKAFQPFRDTIKGLRAEVMMFKADMSEAVASVTFGSTKSMSLEYAVQYRQEAQRLLAEMLRQGDSKLPDIPAPKVDAAGSDRLKQQLDAIRGLFAAHAKAVKPAVDEYERLMARLNAKDVGLDASYWKDLETLHKQYLKTGDLDAYRDAVAKLTMQQKFATDAVRADAAAEKAYADAAEKAKQAVEKNIGSLEDKAAAMEAEVANYGLSESAIQQSIITRLEERKAIYDGIDGYEAEIDAINREIAARQRMAAAAADKSHLDAGKKALEDQAKAWDKFADDIEQSLTDSLFRAFESGDSFGETFVKSLQNTLKSTVLKVAVQAIVSPVTSGLKSMLGAGGSSGGSLLSTAGDAYSLYNNLTGAPGSAYYNFATSGFGQSLGLSSAAWGAAGITDAVGAGIVSGFEAIGVTGATTTGAGATLSSIGAALPWVGGALAVASLLGAFDSGGGPKTEGGLFSTIGGGYNELSSTGQKFFTGDGSDDFVKGYLAPLTKDLQTLAKELGGDATGLELGLGFNSDPQGDSGDSVSGGVYRDGQQLYFKAFGGYGRGTYAEEMATEAKRVMLAALQATDLNDLADAYLDSLDIAGLTDAMASESLTLVALTDDISAAFQKVGFSAEDVTLDLITAMGGFEAAAASVNAMSQALDAINAAAAGTTDMFGQSIRRVEMDVLDNQGKYAYLDAEAQRYRDVLASLSDPAMIAEYAGRLNGSIMEAWGVLGADQQQAKSAEFVALLQQADELALQRYEVSREGVTAQAEAIAAAVKQAVAEAMAENVAASNAVVTAVNNGIDAHVMVNLTIDQIRSAEVGYAV